MVYRLGKRSRRRFIRRVRLVSAALGTGVLISTSVLVYANTNHSSLPFFLSTKKAKKHVSVMTPVKSDNKKASASVTGSSHAPAAVGATTTSSSIVAQAIRDAGCNLFSAGHAGLTNASTPELRKLAQYEQVCSGAVAVKSSFFAPTPGTTAEAQYYAQDMIGRLKEYAKFGIQPLIFFEPNDDNGILDLNQYKAGAYDSALDTYFSLLKSGGITDAMMGTWVVFPEGNLPVWNNSDAATFTTNVTKTIGFQKKYFPQSKASLMLDSETYAPGASWGNGQYISLLPYVQNIPHGYVDSFGLQGFPWAAPANTNEASLYDPSVFLRVDFAVQVAQNLGVNSVWLNTGTFSKAYTNTAAQTVNASAVIRQTTLNSIIAQAKKVKSQGFNVAIHLFAQNKSNTSEAINWAYWDSQPSTDANTNVFTTFAHDATGAGIPIWIFDSY